MVWGGIGSEESTPSQYMAIYELMPIGKFREYQNFSNCSILFLNFISKDDNYKTARYSQVKPWAVA